MLNVVTINMPFKVLFSVFNYFDLLIKKYKNTKTIDLNYRYIYRLDSGVTCVLSSAIARGCKAKCCSLARRSFKIDCNSIQTQLYKGLRIESYNSYALS